MSYTTTLTFTRTHAAYLASKIAADLHQIQNFYGFPSEQHINELIEEATILIAGGYLKSIDYGFLRPDGSWALAVRYEINERSGTLDDHNSGRIPLGVDTSGSRWYSYLRTSEAYNNLSAADQQRVDASLPVKRGSGGEPTINLSGTYDKTYSSNGVEVRRQIFK